MLPDGECLPLEPRALPSPARAFAAALALGLVPARAAAEEPPSRPILEALHVEPNECFDAAALAPHVAGWLHRRDVDRRLDVELRGQPREGAGVEIVIQRDGRAVSSRRLPPLDVPCEEVRAAVGLVASLAIDATVLESLGVRLEPAPPAAAVPVARPHLGVAGSLDAVALVGVLPSPAPAFAPGVTLSITGSLDLRVSALISGSGATTVGGVKLGVSLLAGRADACWAFPRGSIRARACAGLAAGRLETETSGANASRVPASPWVGALGRFDLRWSPARWIGLVAGVDAVLPFYRASFDVAALSGATVASFRLPAVGAAVGGGPELIFW